MVATKISEEKEKKAGGEGKTCIPFSVQCNLDPTHLVGARRLIVSGVSSFENENMCVVCDHCRLVTSIN